MASDIKAGQAIGMVFGDTLVIGIGAWLTYASWTERISGFVSFLPLPIVGPLMVVPGVIILGIGAHDLVQRGLGQRWRLLSGVDGGAQRVRALMRGQRFPANRF